ncbi:MAG: hypothetical protein U1E41_12640 [Paracoccus sp. (in: a-proteobacteria)]|jgi:hypothetical protein
MLRLCPTPYLLVLCIATALGSVAVADQGGQAAPAGASAAARSGNGGVRVGQSVQADKLHRITRPGLYGMSEPPGGSAYGVVDGRLIRYDPKDGRVLSIIRQVDEILD